MSVPGALLVDVDLREEAKCAPPSILVFAAEPAASCLAQRLREALMADARVVADRKSYLEALQRRESSVVVLEESVVTVDPEAADLLYDAAGSAAVLEVNFGISATDRICRRVRAALRRRAQEDERTRSAAVQSLQNELGGSLTGLLLEAQLARRRAEPELRPALDRVVGLAEHLSEQLRSRSGAVPMRTNPV